MDFVTTLPAPITLFRPIVMPGKTIVPPPIQTLSSMVMGRAFVLKNKSPDRSSQSFTKRSFAFIGCVAVYNCTLGAMRTLFPILIILSSKNVQFILIMTLSPIKMCFPHSQWKFISMLEYLPMLPSIWRKRASLVALSVILVAFKRASRF